MSTQPSDYDRIALAIDYLTTRATQQPSLDQVAAHVDLSPAHFQRLFSRWAGVSPKRFLQALTVDRAKVLLEKSQATLEVSGAVGLSSGSRLHDHFVQLEAVTPGEVKTRGAGLLIQYGQHETPFGEAFLACTQRGVCEFAFLEPGAPPGQEALQQKWPKATLSQDKQATRPVLEAMFPQGKPVDRPLSLHVSGTNFQVRVWKALLQLPPGSLTTYKALAQTIGHANSARAVGQAVGANPVAFAIPCHRVIQSAGGLGGYRWGLTRKQAMQAWEATRTGS